MYFIVVRTWVQKKKDFWPHGNRISLTKTKQIDAAYHGPRQNLKSRQNQYYPFSHFILHSNSILILRLTRLVIVRQLFSKVWRSTGTKLTLHSASTGQKLNGKTWRNRCTLDWLPDCSLPGLVLLFRQISLLKLSTGRLTTILQQGKELCRNLLMMCNTQQAVLYKKGYCMVNLILIQS